VAYRPKGRAKPRGGHPADINMSTASQAFLNEPAEYPADSFESRFSRHFIRLALGTKLDRNELALLYEAAFRGDLCHCAINREGPTNGGLRPEDEPARTRLELDFMVAREVFFASPGWQTLTTAEQEVIGD
jgi:hypothetical protein